MSVAASLKTDLKISPLVDLPSAELIERAIKRGEGVLDR
jgi:phosphoenolpyruvate carboxykinase (ATP)